MASADKVETDSTPALQDTRAGETDIKDVRVGIFHADADVNIANHIRDRIKQTGCQVDLCDFTVAGVSKVQNIQDILSSNDLVLWLATPIAIGDDALLKASRDIGLFKAIEDKRFRFAALKPNEYLTLKLPDVLAAYTPLVEDEAFDRALESTLRSVAKKKGSRAPKINQNASTSAVSTSSEIGPTSLPQVVAVSSDETEMDLCAQPIRQTEVENQGPDPASTVNIFQIEATHVHIQTDAGGQISTDPK